MFLVLNSLSVHKINVKHYLSLYLINKKEHNLSKLIGLLNLRLVLSLHVQIFKVKFFYILVNKYYLISSYTENLF